MPKNTINIFLLQIKLVYLYIEKDQMSSSSLPRAGGFPRVKQYYSMKTIRNYRFVLTVVDNDQLAAGETAILKDEVCGERMFKSECHYYCEKNLVECVKQAEKDDALGTYYSHTYLIYKETKPQTKTTTEEKDGKKIVTTEELPTTAMLVETITIDENGINIQ